MTKFQQWAKTYGVAEIVRELRTGGRETTVTFGTVYQWLRGEHEPRGPKCRLMVAMSNGALSLEDLAQHFQILRGKNGH